MPTRQSLDQQKRFPWDKKLREGWRTHKWNALVRGIPFLLSYEEWLAIWEASGHLAERGAQRGQYCMARFGDVGPYAVDNVEIILHSENIVPRKPRSK